MGFKSGLALIRAGVTSPHGCHWGDPLRYRRLLGLCRDDFNPADTL
jgi:hypothetical protein